MGPMGRDPQPWTDRIGSGLQPNLERFTSFLPSSDKKALISRHMIIWARTPLKDMFLEVDLFVYSVHVEPK